MPASLTYQRLRAARQDGALVTSPPATAWARHLDENCQQFAAAEFDVQGRSFQSLRAAARRDVLRLAERYTASYLDSSAPASTTKIVLSGHQPELFHPGVWAKNFAAAQLAEATGSVSIHVIIDNDLMRKQSVLVPTPPVATPRVVSESFDHYQTPQPYESRQLIDQGTFESFSRRVRRHLEPVLGRELIVSAMWDTAVQAISAGQPIGLAFSQARHRLEHQWGLRTLDVPLSQLCDSVPFYWFLADLLLRGDAVRDQMNRWLDEYRRVHRIRTLAQPMPNLKRRSGWTEAPFWFWTNDNPERMPLWWKRSGKTLTLGTPDRDAWTFHRDTPTPEGMCGQLQELRRQGVRIRPRALTSTLFLRLFVGDVFIHGIGGAKYDQITDRLIADLYGAPVPHFYLLSQTSQLPVEFRQIAQDEIAEKRSLLRQMHFHPEAFLSRATFDTDQVSNWVREKKQVIAEITADGSSRDRHVRLQAANVALRRFLLKKREEQENVLAELESHVAPSRVWSSREWPYILYPESFLRRRLLDLPFAQS